MNNIAVMSDIHGNYVALEKCIEYALERKVDTFIFLGDYVGELAYPEKTMEIIYKLQNEYDCYFIKGNKEDYWIDYQYNGEVGWKDKDSTTGSLLYTYKNLSIKDIEFFRKLNFTQSLSFEGLPSIRICHGSPYSANEKLMNNDRTYEIMEEVEESIILSGHTHIQGKIERNGKIVLNPGAVGVPLYSEGKAQFMIFNNNDGKLDEEFISLEYDVEKVIDDLSISGVEESAPYWCEVTKNLLRRGNISHGTVLARAMNLCTDETGKCDWPDVPEEYWKQAVDELIIIDN